MKLYETESHMLEDDRYDRVYYSSHYTGFRSNSLTNAVTRMKNFIKTSYSPKK